MVKEYWKTYNEIANDMNKININDLSVGDWVCAVCGERLTPPMRVVGLGESWVWLEIDPEQGDPFEFEPSEIRGVEITAEVLEKNGLHDAEYGLVIKPKDDKLCASVGVSIEIKYVHELQHVLKFAKVGKEIVL